MMSTLFKYCPQVYMNYKRKSTRGWSIGNVLLDFTGGICSVSQLLLDAILAGKCFSRNSTVLLIFRADNFEGIAGNAVKLFLGVVSLLFDCIFIAQHYFIYASNSRKAWRRSSESITTVDDKPLLPGETINPGAGIVSGTSSRRSTPASIEGSPDEVVDVFIPGAINKNDS